MTQKPKDSRDNTFAHVIGFGSKSLRDFVQTQAEIFRGFFKITVFPPFVLCHLMEEQGSVRERQIKRSAIDNSHCKPLVSERSIEVVALGMH